jgi:hypothetical protein
MSDQPHVSANSIHIENVRITSERLQSQWDIQLNVYQIDIYENIDLPYLTGQLFVSDSNNMFEKINFRGTEKVDIRLRIPGDQNAIPVEKSFRVINITKIAPTNDTSEAMVLDLIEEHAYLSRLKPISQSYEGLIDDMITKIARSELKKEVKPVFGFAGVLQERMRVVIPNWTPLDTIRWLKDRATSERGLPMYVYSTLNDDELLMTTLENMLSDRAPVINRDRPFRFSQVFNNQATESNDLRKMGQVIEQHQRLDTENMNEMMRTGAVAATPSFINTLKEFPRTPKTPNDSVTDQKVLDALRDTGIFQSNQTDIIYDNQTLFDGQPLQEYMISQPSQIVTSNTYEDMYNYYEDAGDGAHKNKTKARLLRQYLLKSPMTMIVPGFYFLKRGGGELSENLTIGRQMRFEFLKNDQDVYQGPYTSTSEVMDTKKSGDYIVYALKHNIMVNDYTVHIAAGKLANLRDEKAGTVGGGSVPF